MKLQELLPPESVIVPLMCADWQVGAVVKVGVPEMTPLTVSKTVPAYKAPVTLNFGLTFSLRSDSGTRKSQAAGEPQVQVSEGHAMTGLGASHWILLVKVVVQPVLVAEKV
jgi:hypothetical protein